MERNIAIKAFIITCLAIIVLGCNPGKVLTLKGKTMGTRWHITLVDNDATGSGDLKKKITDRLDEINRSMSLFDEKSELSKFNSSKQTGEKICVSESFLKVFKIGEIIHRTTNGAWDGTIGPLVNLWGFGNRKQNMSIPDLTTIQEEHSKTGYDAIKIIDGACLIKTKPVLELDFGSIAKGYAVDEIVDILRKNGLNHFLVEIGGEVYASGTKKGKKWRVGVNTPSSKASLNQVYMAVELKNRAIATSGDYRNFRKIDGVLYSHVIDPKTGWPVSNGVASVSVSADTAVFADGLATAVMVMGHVEGLRLVELLEDVECLIIVRNIDDTFTEYPSSSWLI